MSNPNDLLLRASITQGQLVDLRSFAREAADIIAELRAELIKLRARVGWLDRLDTDEGRRQHVNELLRAENDKLRAALAAKEEA